MKKKIIGIKLVAAFMLFGSLLISAQTTKRKPKPLATPLPTLSGAEIISRAGELDDQNTTTTAPVERPTQKNTSTTSTKIRNLNDRMDRLESSKKEDPDAKQRRMLLNLDILTRAEQRSESLRKQLFEMTEKENSIKTRLDQIEIDSRPEMIERSLQLAGSLRPEEVRDARRRTLDAEKANLESLLTQLQTTRASVSLSLEKADAMVDKLRTKLDKEIDETFLKDDQPDDQ
jgi:hypothetical protein